MRAMLAAGERALHVEGDLTDARSWFAKAYAAAEHVGDRDVMAAAALGLGGLWVHEHRTAADAASVACGVPIGRSPVERGGTAWNGGATPYRVTDGLTRRANAW
jgi:hypothetical protein